MKGSGVLLLMALVLPLLFIARRSEAIEGDPNGFPPPEGKTSPVEGSGGTKMAPPDSMKADEEKRAKDQGGVGQGETRRDNGRNDSEEKPSETKYKNLKEPTAEEGKEGKESSDGGSDSKTEHVVDSSAEECDPLNRCIDEKNNFIACLRVPGKDSLDLSLLIQNKGTVVLDVNIVAPSFVNLEQATVQLQPKENKEVKVSVRDVTNETVIVLKAGEGNCSIDFQNMIAVSIRKSEPSALPRFIRLSTRAYLICIFLAAATIAGAASWLCVRFRRLHNKEGGPGYCKVELGLPVSSGGKKGADEADGWDNSWADGWDDEEAPMTPSKPVANPSSKGLASRRSNKDGWKD